MTCCATKANILDLASGSAYYERARTVTPANPDVRTEIASRLVSLDGGIFDMGARRSKYPKDLDSPRRKIRISPFAISPTACTNADYAQFVAETNYRSVAEQEGWSFVFYLLLEDPRSFPLSPQGLPWWRKVDGACWSAPEGPGSDIADRPDHPAVHLCWYDALAYCNWAGLSLPTEAQWEFAARGGLARKKFPWGNALTPAGKQAMNIWQGLFPSSYTGDASPGTMPVKTFEPNNFGLWNMCGNVWEWVRDNFEEAPLRPRIIPQDPVVETDSDRRIQRGGSYLCHESYCDRYHVHSRTSNNADSATGNAGFRVARVEPQSAY